MDPEQMMKMLQLMQSETSETTQGFLDTVHATNESRYIENGERAGEHALEVATKIYPLILPMLQQIKDLDAVADKDKIEFLQKQVDSMAKVMGQSVRLQEIANDRLAKLPPARRRR